MTTTVINPETVIITRPSLIGRLAGGFKRSWNWLRRGGRSIAHGGRVAVSTTAAYAQAGGSMVWSGLRTAAAWTRSHAVYAVAYPVQGIKWLSVRIWQSGTWLGQLFFRGVGYLGYAVSAAIYWIVTGVQGSVVLASIAIGAICLAFIGLFNLLRDAYAADARIFRWMSKKKRGTLKSESVDNPLVPPATDMHDRWERKENWVNRLASWVMGYDVAIYSNPVDHDNEVKAWGGEGNKEYKHIAAMTYAEVMEYYQEMIEGFEPANDSPERSRYEGRLLYLKTFAKDLAHHDPEAVYDAWRRKQPKKRRQGTTEPLRREFRQGVLEEATRIFDQDTLGKTVDLSQPPVEEQV